MDFIQVINEAKKEAFKQAIMANAIFINKNFMATKPIMISLFRDVQIVKPMILGLKADITDELPDDVAFAITAVDEEKLMTEHERQIRKDTAKEILQELWNSRTVTSGPESLLFNYSSFKRRMYEKYGVELTDNHIINTDIDPDEPTEMHACAACNKVCTSQYKLTDTLFLCPECTRDLACGLFKAKFEKDLNHEHRDD